MKKTALITGASSGIGKELAYIHAKNNGDLILIARNEKALTTIKNDIESTYKSSVTIISQDLTEINAPQNIYNSVKSSNLSVDYLINNAGFGGIGALKDRDMNEDLNMIQLNIVALTALTHLFLKDFISNNSGKILNVSSTASLMPGPLQPVYFATKAYVTSFSNAIAKELEITNITVTNLMPGATETEFGKKSGMDKTSLFDKTANAHKVALDGYNAMIKGKLDVISGLTFSQKILTSLIPLMPKKIVLQQMYSRQKIK